jgi:hypothetical protein
MSINRVVVISSRGKMVGFWLPDFPGTQPPVSDAPRANVVAGPGQRLHEIELEDPKGYIQRRNMPELHKLLKKRLKLK